MGTPSYPGALKTYSDEVNKQDLADAAVINSLQDEVAAIEAELGIDPAGSLATVKARLDLITEDNGAINQGTSFPGSPVDGQMFYRTDENVLYVYNGSSWDSQGQSLSNVLFHYQAAVESSGVGEGEYSGTDLTANSQTGNYRYMQTSQASYTTVLTSKFTKIAGISTVTVYGELWGDSGSTDVASLQVNIGGQTGSVSGTTAQRTPEWKNFTVDVSGLSDGTVYDILVQIKHAGDGNHALLGTVIMFGS